jgi:integrase
MQVGFSKDEVKKYTFHAWRHFYTSYMLTKLGKKLLKTQTGHKTDEMLYHYGEHELEGDREIIEATGREVFAGLLPEPSLKIVSNNTQLIKAVS